MENKNLTKLQSTIMKEIDFFTSEDLNLEQKEERLRVSEMINKLANTYIQAENIIERKRLNDVKFKENERLAGKHNGNSN